MSETAAVAVARAGSEEGGRTAMVEDGQRERVWRVWEREEGEEMGRGEGG